MKENLLTMEIMTAQSMSLVPADGGEVLNVIGERITFKATPADTGNAFFCSK